LAAACTRSGFRRLVEESGAEPESFWAAIVETDGFSYLVLRRTIAPRLTPVSLRHFKRLLIAAALLALDTTALDHSVIEGELKEICNEEIPPAN
jgi:hypothetical protein